MFMIKVDNTDQASDWIKSVTPKINKVGKKVTGRFIHDSVTKFEIPDELLEAIDIDPKKMSPDQIKAMFAKLKEKGLLNDKPADKKSVGKGSDTKEPDDAQGSRPGLVKKKVTVKRANKSSEEYRWVKSGEDEPAEKPKKGEEKPGEVPGKSPGKSAEPEKPKGPVIIGLNKPDSDNKESDKDDKEKLKNDKE